jgi:ribosomal protein L40E
MLIMESHSVEQIVCPKCKHVNDPMAEQCAQCQGHLYIQCRSCGMKHPRQSKRCSECGAELHRIKRKRREHRLYFKNGSWKFILLGLVITLAVLAWIIMRTLKP